MVVTYSDAKRCIALLLCEKHVTYKWHGKHCLHNVYIGISPHGARFYALPVDARKALPESGVARVFRAVLRTVMRDDGSALHAPCYELGDRRLVARCQKYLKKYEY